MPTTAAQPYFHQPSVTAHLDRDARQAAGSTDCLYWALWRSKALVLGMETTRTAIFCAASSACAAFSASCTSEPEAMMTARVLPCRRRSAGSLST